MFLVLSHMSYDDMSYSALNVNEKNNRSLHVPYCIYKIFIVEQILQLKFEM